MAYRNIDVYGKAYRYSVGRTHTKIRGVGVFANSEIGNRVLSRQAVGELYRVSPANVRAAILGLPVPSFEKRDGSRTTDLALVVMEDDYIDGRLLVVPACEEKLAECTLA